MSVEDMENKNDINEIDENLLDKISGGYRTGNKINGNNYYVFKAMCAKCGHEEKIVLEKQEVKTWICISCKTWNVSKIKSGSMSQCCTYTVNEYERILKGGSSI